jgi:transcriptional regulator with XRE-family HTH domain
LTKSVKNPIVNETRDDDKKEYPMQLTQPEIIQILRRRKGLNQAELGVKAFGLSPDSARTKIKNIELGRQLPSAEDSEKLARALDVEIAVMVPTTTATETGVSATDNACHMTPETLQLFPGLADYVDMLNNAVRIGDQDLIGYIAGKLSSLFAVNYKGNAAGQS